MNASEKINQALKGIMSDGEANACRIWKGYDVGTGETGWHFQRFGQTATFIGANAVDALETIADMTQERADEHAEAMRSLSRGRGRPVLSDSPTVKIEITLPADLRDKLDGLTDNRSAWVRQALEAA